jgi:hypothetical protein
MPRSHQESVPPSSRSPRSQGPSPHVFRKNSTRLGVVGGVHGHARTLGFAEANKSGDNLLTDRKMWINF